MNDRLLGKILDGRYKISAVLGAGGMGTVYKGSEISLERTVAIKLIKPHCLDQDGVARFEREAAILASMSHQNIMLFYRFGIAPDGSYYMVTEYLEGQTLRQLLFEEDSIDWRRAAELGVQICAGLSIAHQKGIVHRDLKPENIMLVSKPELVKILDFGLGTIVGTVGAASGPEYQKLTKTGQIIGTINYLSPEQCAGKKSDQRSDIYALGCILYECVTGEAPFAADNSVTVMYKHTNEKAKPFASFASSKNTPEEFEHLVNKALTKDPALRYQSMSDLQQDLQALLNAGPQAQPARKEPKKIGKIAVSVMVLVLVLGGVIGGAFLLRKKAAGRAVSARQGQDPLLKFEKLSGRAQYQAVMKEYASTGESSKTKEMLELALNGKSLSTSERVQLEFLHTIFLKSPELQAKSVNLLCRMAGLPEGSFPTDVYYSLLYTLAEMTQNSCLRNQSSQLFETMIKGADKHGLPTSEVGRIRRFNWSTYCQSKLFLATNKYNLGKVEEAKKLAQSVVEIDEAQVPWQMLSSTLVSFGEDGLAKDLIMECKKPDYLCDLSEGYIDTNRLDYAREALALARKNLEGMRDNKFLDDVLFTEALVDSEDGKSDAAGRLVKFANEDLATLDIRKRQLIGRRLVSWLYFYDRKAEAKRLLNDLISEKDKLPDIADRFQFRQTAQKLLTDRDVDKSLQGFRLVFTSRLSPVDHVNMVSNTQIWGHPDVMLFLNSDAYNLALTDQLPVDLRLHCMARFIEGVCRIYHLPIKTISVCDQMLDLIKAKHAENVKTGVDSKLTYQLWAQFNKARALQKIGKIKEAIAIADQIELAEVPKEQTAEIYSLEQMLKRVDKQKMLIDHCDTVLGLCQIARLCYPYRQFEEANRCLAKAATLSKTSEDKAILQNENASLALEQGEPERAEKLLQNYEKQNSNSDTSIAITRALVRLSNQKAKIFARAYLN